MGFISVYFVVFIFVTYCLYYVVPSRFQWMVLLAASILFYMSFDFRAIIFLLVSSGIIYAAAIIVFKRPNGQVRNAVVIFSIGINIFLLMAFKYFPFFGRLWPDGNFIFELREQLMDKYSLVVPIGISFYTLALMGYLLDVYRLRYEPERNILKVFLFASFFPHILQGPIARYDQLSTQFQKKHLLSYNRTMYALQLMIWGYMKKMVIADRVSIFVDAVYSNYGLVGGTELFIASLLYSIQIYADFSGCVDIAAGTAELFDIRLMDNFKRPYLAGSVREFWKRWHISLSSWYRDYLYIPLGGGRKGKARRWINIFIVFLMSGIWHGAGLNFIAWGIIHGAYQIIGDCILPLQKKGMYILKIDENSAWWVLWKRMMTFLFVNFAWIFFKADGWRMGARIVVSIFRYPSPWVMTDGTLYKYGISANMFCVLILFIILLLVVDMLHEKNISIRKWIAECNIIVRWLIYYAALCAILVFGAYGMGYQASEFIYMQF